VLFSFIFLANWKRSRQISLQAALLSLRYHLGSLPCLLVDAVAFSQLGAFSDSRQTVLIT